MVLKHLQSLSIIRAAVRPLSVCSSADLTPVNPFWKNISRTSFITPKRTPL